MEDSFDFDSLKVARENAEKHGWAVFPLFGIKRQQNKDGSYIMRCTCGKLDCGKNSGKHPATFRGFKDASTNPAVIHNLWQGRKGLNYGIATGAVSGIVVIDIDGDEGEESLRELEKKLGKLPETYTVSTARGRHLYFKYPDRQVFSTSQDLGKKIDVRADNGYVVGPGSKHLLGIPYDEVISKEAAPLSPKWVDRMASKTRKAPVVKANFSENTDRQEWSKSEVQGMLDALDPDMGRDEWLNIGMALHDGGYPFEMWRDWSSGSSDKYDAADIIKQWRSFHKDGGITMGTLVEMATLNGWKPDDYITEDTEVSWENHPAGEWAMRVLGAADEEVAVEEQPDDERGNTNFGSAHLGLPYYLDPGSLDAGLIGDTVRWICSSSYKPQPELALLNVLAALAAVFGRRYANTTGLRSNLYICGVADTAEGKDRSRELLSVLMREAGLEAYCAPEEIISVTGLQRQIERKPASIMMIDEFGLVLGHISGENTPPYLAQLNSFLLKIYTKSNAIYECGTYADGQKEQIVLNYPCLSIYGTTTLDTYLQALKKIAITSGSMNRFIVLPGRERPKGRKGDIVSDIPDNILRQWKALSPPGGLEEMNSNLITPDPQVIDYADKAASKFADDLVDIEESLRYPDKKGDNTNTKSLYGRYRAQILKVAMVWAISDNVERPRITLSNLKNAQRIVEASLFYMMELVDEYMYENEVARRKVYVYKAIRNAGPKGIKKSVLTKKFRELRAAEMKDIILSLIEEKSIVAKKTKTKTRSAITYHARFGLA